MSRRGRPISPFYLFAFILWIVLYGGALYLLEQRFPDAAFFSNDNDAAMWVWLGGSVVSAFCAFFERNSYEIPRHAKLRSDRSRDALLFDLYGSGADLGKEYIPRTA